MAHVHSWLQLMVGTLWRALATALRGAPIRRNLSALGPRASPEILLGSYPTTFITSQVPLCFSHKEAQSQNLTHSGNCTVSEYFMNRFYLILLSS